MSRTIEKHNIPGEGGWAGPQKADNQDSNSEDRKRMKGEEPYTIFTSLTQGLEEL